MPRIPDDGTMEAALYGTAHIGTCLARSDCAKIRSALETSMAETMAGLDLDRAEEIVIEHPELVWSDDPVPEGSPDRDVIAAVRGYLRGLVAVQLIDQWERGIDARGRMIGLGEHSARVCGAGLTDAIYDSAIARFGDRRGR
ncbi:MAG: hypothetical protein LKJ94_05810 [Candidatus Methanomethylophilus sp.]|jgi:hypothetical protein|nr:hypothetical protein [Methanomethylophilus sp.]MCI2092538.1 hypothetical protein [Methanomethylophilus sp.]